MAKDDSAGTVRAAMGPPGGGMRTSRALALAFAGLLVIAGAVTLFVGYRYRATALAERLLSVTDDVVHDTLESEVCVQLFVMSADQRSLREYRAALERAWTDVGILEKEAPGLGEGGPLVGVAIRGLKEKLDAWNRNYAGPAILFKREGRSQKLSALNRARLSTVLSSDLRDALASLREHVETAVAANMKRARMGADIALLALAIGLLMIAGAGYTFYRRASAALADLRTHSDALELLAHWAERIQNIFSQDDAVRALANTLTDRAGMGRATVMVRSPEEMRLRIAADFRSPDSGPPSPAPDSASEDCNVAESGQGIVVVEPGQGHSCDCPFARQSAGGFVCLPLTGKGQVLGVVRAEAKRGQPLRRSSIARIESLVRLTSKTLNTLLSLADAKQQATTDPLTGVFNRRFLDAYLPKQLQLAARNGHPLTVLMLDLDHFKDFNDRWGHAAGDALLKAFAGVLLASIREGDLVARYGGEEFTVVLSSTSCEEAMTVAERIRAGTERMKAESLIGLAPPLITVSVGLSCADGGTATVGGLMKSADDALYQAKDGGRNRIVTAGG